MGLNAYDYDNGYGYEDDYETYNYDDEYGYGYKMDQDYGYDEPEYYGEYHQPTYKELKYEPKSRRGMGFHQHRDPHVGYLTGITVPNWHAYDLSVKHEQVAHLPTQPLDLDKDTLHALRSGVVPSAAGRPESESRYLETLVDRVLGTTEVVTKTAPTPEEVDEYARNFKSGTLQAARHDKAVQQNYHPEPYYQYQQPIKSYEPTYPYQQSYQPAYQQAYQQPAYQAYQQPAYQAYQEPAYQSYQQPSYQAYQQPAYQQSYQQPAYQQAYSHAGHY